MADVAVDADSSSPVVETSWLPGRDDTDVGVALIESLPDITLLNPEPLSTTGGFLTRDEERCLVTKYRLCIYACMCTYVCVSETKLMIVFLFKPIIHSA